MKIHYKELPIDNPSLIQPLCDALMAFQKSKAHIHPEWFDGMSYETRMLPAIKGAKENKIIVAFDGDTPIGYAYSNICPKNTYSGGFATLQPVDFFDFKSVQGDDVGCLSQFYLQPEYRGTGVGGALFDQSIEWLKSFSDIKDTFIFVSNGNQAAMDFYLHKGFSYSHDILDGFIQVLRGRSA